MPPSRSLATRQASGVVCRLSAGVVCRRCLPLVCRLSAACLPALSAGVVCRLSAACLPLVCRLSAACLLGLSAGVVCRLSAACLLPLSWSPCLPPSPYVLFYFIFFLFVSPSPCCCFVQLSADEEAFLAGHMNANLAAFEQIDNCTFDRKCSQPVSQPALTAIDVWFSQFVSTPSTPIRSLSPPPSFVSPTDDQRSTPTPPPRCLALPAIKLPTPNRRCDGGGVLCRK